MKFAVHVISLAVLAASVHASYYGGFTKKSLRHEGVVTSLQFNQRLLVCNAYPSMTPAVVKKNEREQLVGTGLGYKQCSYVQDKVKPHDKLDFLLQNSGVSGSFEVGDLPEADAVLLLVLQKRDDKSPMVAFQSFAFPTHVDGVSAQLAVIDTFKGNSSSPHLRMADHVKGEEKETVSKRVEKLNFNRVYAIEEGVYDASVMDHPEDPDEEKTLEQGTETAIKLKKNQNYVILRTGDDKDFAQSLLVFPDAAHSGSTRFASLSALLLVAIAAAFL